MNNKTDLLAHLPTISAPAYIVTFFTAMSDADVAKWLVSCGNLSATVTSRLSRFIIQ